jgi:hypothetical protein
MRSVKNFTTLPRAKAVVLMSTGVKNKAELILALLYAGMDDPKGPQRSVEVEGITRLEKLLFLLKQEKQFLKNVSQENDFHFFPFKMGPWTNEVYDEVDFLESLELVSKVEESGSNAADEAYVDELFSNSVIEKYQRSDFGKEKGTEVFKLTTGGKEKAAAIWQRLEPSERADIIDIKKKFNKMTLKQFLRYVYMKYPEYTTKSEIKDSLGL